MCRADAEAERFLSSRAEPVPIIESSEDVVVSAVGRELYEKFFRGYQRSSLGPIRAPTTATSAMPSEYQVNTKSAETSEQCRP